MTAAWLQGRLRSGFRRYGRLVARWPWAVCCSGLLFLLCTLPGLLLFEFNSDDHNLYLRDSYATNARDRMTEHFSFNPAITGVTAFFIAKDSRNLFTETALREYARAVDRLTGLRTSSGESHADVCEKSWRGFCELDSVLVQFNSSAGSLGFAIAPQPGLSENEGLALQLYHFCSQSPAACDEWLRHQERYTVALVPGKPPSKGVASLSLFIYLDGKRETEDGGSSATEWQLAFLEEVHAPSYSAGADNLQTDNFFVTSWSKAHQDFEARRPAKKEEHLMAVTFLLINFFLCCAISAPGRPRSRVLLAVCCTLVVMLSLGVAMGLSSYMGVPCTTATLLVIFTLFGVSVDDIIVIVHAYDRVPGDLSLEGLEERMVSSLQDSGPAITLTSTTSLVAFLFSSFIPIPIISWACISAAFGILAVFVLQMLIFLPFFVMDERRRLLGQRDCCTSACLGPIAAESEARGEGGGGSCAGKVGSAAIRALTAPSVEGGCGIFDWLGRRTAASPVLQGVVAVAFAAVVGLGVWGSSAASTEGDVTDYYIDDSYAHEFISYSRELWATPTPFYLVIEHQNEGLFSDATLAELDAVYADMRDLDITRPPFFNWLWDFEAYLGTLFPSDSGGLAAERALLQGSPGAFGARVAKFLDSPSFARQDGSLCSPWRHKRDVTLEGGVVTYSRIQVMYSADLTSPAKYTSDFHSAMAVIFPHGFNSKMENPRVPHTFGVSFLFPLSQRDEIMVDIIFKNLGIACAAVAAVLMLLLHPLVGVLVGVLIVGLDCIIVAMLVLYGSSLDIVALICLTMNIGLVVDYSTHTAFTYVKHPGSPEEKLCAAISKMGASVLSGGGSTLLGICALGFASSKGFRTFFFVLGTAVLMGTLVGITVSPILLCIFHRAYRAVRGCLEGKGPKGGHEGVVAERPIPAFAAIEA